MSQDSGWCTIESDPGVFTELLRSIGVKDVQLEELYTLDKDHIRSFGHIYGIVFLFKYRDDERQKARTRSGRVVNPPPDRLFFANQTIQNACATQAILSVVMNVPEVTIGDELERFRDFCQGMDSVTKGMVVSNSEVIRSAHNSFAPQQQFVVENSVMMEKEDPFHFVAYIPHDGKVYELDGLQEGPREHGSVDEKGDWLDLVTPVIQRRIEEYNGSEIRFNLMVVVEDPRARLEKMIEECRKNGEEGKIVGLEAELIGEREKHERWETENVRRRWNYVPFIVDLFKKLAETGHMQGLIESATEKKKEAYKRHVEQEKEKEGASK